MNFTTVEQGTKNSGAHLTSPTMEYKIREDMARSPSMDEVRKKIFTKLTPNMPCGGYVTVENITEETFTNATKFDAFFDRQRSCHTHYTCSANYKKGN